MSPSQTDLHLATALSVAEAGAVLFAQKVATQTGRPVPAGGPVLHDPALALATLKQAALDDAGNPRVRAAALACLCAFFGEGPEETVALIRDSGASVHELRRAS